MGDGITFEHDAFAGGSCQYIRSHGEKFCLGDFDETEVAELQFLVEGDAEQGWVDDGEVVVYDADEREQVEAGFGAGVVGEFDGDDGDADGLEGLAKLAESFGVGAEALADGEGVVVEPKEVTTFGTRFTMQSRFYADVFERAGIAVVSPSADEQEAIHAIT